MTNTTATLIQPANPTAAVKTRGAAVIAALEEAWAALQANHADLPDVVIITGTGGGREWGHTWAERWTAAPIGTDVTPALVPAARLTEVMITGERLACGAALTFQTLIHEAAHVLAHSRGEADTSRQGRYHNKTFVRLATELGLEWPTDAKADKIIGFSAVVLREDTRASYSEVITRLGEAISLYLELPGILRMLLGAQDDEDGNEDNGSAGTLTVPPVKVRRKGKARNLNVATCGCPEPRKIRIAPATLGAAPITCGACGESFDYRDPAGDSDED